MSKFTPGPWSVNTKTKHIFIEGPEGQYLFDVFKGSTGLDEAVFNANLVAAAPELYRMLELASEALPEQSYFRKEIDRTLARARGLT